MKVTMEVDISPQEVLELFEGNVESLQRALLAGMMQMSEKAMKDNGLQPNQFYDYWKQAAEAGQNFFKDSSGKKTGQK